MELEVFTTNVELQDIPSYSTNISVEGQLLKLSFLWNERIGKRVLSIKNTSDVVYLQNTILHPNEPLELNSNAVLDDLPYSVTLVKTGDVNKVGNIFNWSKDFILCFSRTVDLDVKKLNVVYGVTTPSTPILPKPFGDWILNQGFTVLGDDIRCTGYKTNGIDIYDSFADFDLVTALVRSFHDSDLQQYAAFTTVVEQLIGTVDWVLDPTNNQIRYEEQPPSDGTLDPNYQYICNVNTTLYNQRVDTVTQCGQAYVEKCNQSSGCALESVVSCHYTNNAYCVFQRKPQYGGTTNSQVATRVPRVDPIPELEEKYLPLDVVAAQVISNADSGEDQVLQLLSQDYVNLVANSIFDTNASKQFVKLEDLIPQLEANKVLR